MRLLLSLSPHVRRVWPNSRHKLHRCLAPFWGPLFPRFRFSVTCQCVCVCVCWLVGEERKSERGERARGEKEREGRKSERGSSKRNVPAARTPGHPCHRQSHRQSQSHPCHRHQPSHRSSHQPSHRPRHRPPAHQHTHISTHTSVHNPQSPGEGRASERGTHHRAVCAVPRVARTKHIHCSTVSSRERKTRSVEGAVACFTYN